MKGITKMILLAGLTGANLGLDGPFVTVASGVELPDAAGLTACPTNGLRLRFRGAPLEKVLNYLGEAAGFTIVLEARLKGVVDVWSEQPLDRDEAFNLVNSVLMKNGLAAIRSGQTLTIVNRDEAKVHDISVKLGSDPAAIPRTDEVVTQILPVRFVEVGQLVKDLQPLASARMTMTANESANTLVITDTQANIHRMAEVVKAIDGGAEDFTAVRVFHLQNADATEMADLLSELFPDQSRSETGQSPVQFGGGMPGPPPGMEGLPRAGGFGVGGPGGAAGADGQSAASQRIRKGAKVTAVADPRTASVVVTAPKNLMGQVEGVVSKLDANPARKQRVMVYQLRSAQPQDVLKVLQALFQNTGASNSGNTSSQTDVLETRRATQTQQQLNNGNSFGNTGRSSSGLGSAGGGSPSR